MNIWDPIWKEEKEDNISDPIYKMKPILINLDGISFTKSVKNGHIMLWNKFYLDIEFKEDYINTLEVDKRKLWILDDGGCVINCSIYDTGLPSNMEQDINNMMSRKRQRKWVVEKITNGVRLTVDRPVYQIMPTVSGRVQAKLGYTWNFGSVKVLIPEPMKFDSTVVTIQAGFAFNHVGPYNFPSASSNYKITAFTEYEHVTNINSYESMKNLQLEKSSLVSLHKFTIESAKNLVNELKDVVSIPFPINMNYVLENHPEYPIAYARSRNNYSIGSSSKPKEKCHKNVSPITLTDQTQCKGRSLNKLGIVGKILSIIKRRKREIK